MKNIERPTSWGRNHGARKENMAPTLYGWIIAPLSISWCLSQMFRHVHPAWVPSMACHATRRYKELVHRPSDPKRLDVVLRFLEHVWFHMLCDEHVSMTCSIFANTWNLNAILGKTAAICSSGPSNTELLPWILLHKVSGWTFHLSCGHPKCATTIRMLAKAAK